MKYLVLLVLLQGSSPAFIQEKRDTVFVLDTDTQRNKLYDINTSNTSSISSNDSDALPNSDGLTISDLKITTSIPKTQSLTEILPTTTTTTTTTTITTTTTTTAAAIKTTTTITTTTTSAAALKTTTTTTTTTIITAASIKTTTTKTTTTTTTTPETSTSITTESPDKSLQGWALAAISLGVSVIVLIFILLLFLKYRRSKIPLAKPVSGLFRKSTVERSPGPIRVSAFHREYQVRQSNELINEEFERIQEFSARVNANKSRSIGQDEKNRTRNRFVDIIPFDDNYVKLDCEEGNPPSDYINASYIRGIPGVRDMIATQGPKQNTVVEFWRMIVEKGSQHIINLTNCMEGGRVKCFQYWPPNGQMLHFDDVSLFTKQEVELQPGLFLRTIEVQLGDEPECDNHIVKQLHLTSWPDHGVPNNINNLLGFLRIADSFGGEGFTVIHCSAGVGRTGTYIALTSLIYQAQHKAEIDVMKTVFQLRSLRPKLVQAFEQYKLLYQVLDVYLKSDDVDEEDGVGRVGGDAVLDAGIDNFGFEHVKL